MALNKDWKDLPASLAPAAGETPANWHARINAYDVANPGVLTKLSAAALKDVEGRVQTELNAKAALTDARFPAGADIVDADISATAGIGEGKLALASDAAAATASRRSLGTGAAQALPGNHISTTNARPPMAHKATHATGGTDALTPADIGAQAAAEAWRYVGAPGEPGFGPNWSNYTDTGGPYVAARFSKWGPFTVIQGMVKATGNFVAGETMFVLPLGYRPTETVLVLGMSNGVTGRFDIQPSGAVIWKTGFSIYLNLAASGSVIF